MLNLCSYKYFNTYIEFHTEHVIIEIKIIQYLISNLPQEILYQ